jgi:hypothetical protein
MKIKTKFSIVVLATLSLVRLAQGNPLSYATSGQSLNSNWTTASIPAGAVAHSVAIASPVYMPGPSSWYGATLWGGTWLQISWYADGSGNRKVDLSAWTLKTIYFGGVLGSQWDANPQSSYAYAAIGISGPPSGLVHEARATSTSGTILDEKTSTLAGGVYQVYHGGGVSGNGAVSGYTYISW